MTWPLRGGGGRLPYTEPFFARYSLDFGGAVFVALMHISLDSILFCDWVYVTVNLRFSLLYTRALMEYMLQFNLSFSPLYIGALIEYMLHSISASVPSIPEFWMRICYSQSLFQSILYQNSDWVYVTVNLCFSPFFTRVLIEYMLQSISVSVYSLTELWSSICYSQSLF